MPKFISRFIPVFLFIGLLLGYLLFSKNYTLPDCHQIQYLQQMELDSLRFPYFIPSKELLYQKLEKNFDQKQKLENLSESNGLEDRDSICLEDALQQNAQIILLLKSWALTPCTYVPSSVFEEALSSGNLPYCQQLLRVLPGWFQAGKKLLRHENLDISPSCLTELEAFFLFLDADVRSALLKLEPKSIWEEELNQALLANKDFIAFLVSFRNLKK